MDTHGIKSRLEALAARLADPVDPTCRSTTAELRTRICSELGLSPSELRESAQDGGLLTAFEAELSRRGIVAGESEGEVRS